MDKIYEAVVVDEELGMNADKEEADATPITPPSTDINRPVIVILYYTVVLLSISLHVSNFKASEEVICFNCHYSQHHRKAPITSATTPNTS